MASIALQTLTRRLGDLLTPENRDDAELRIELLRIIARIYRPCALYMPAAAALLVIADLQWVDNGGMLLWLAAVILAVLLPVLANKALLKGNPRPEEAGWWMLRVTLTGLPLQIIWPSMVAFAWVDGNGANNAFLLSFLCSGLVIGAAITAPSLPQTLIGVACYIPFLAYFTISGAGSFEALNVAMQVGFGFVMAGLAYNIHVVVVDRERQRLRNARMAKELAAANATSDLARRQAEDANRSKSEFLAAMSHDLRTPLNAVIGFSDLIRQGIYGPIAPARYANYIDDIHLSGKHLLNLINDILDLAKIEAGKREFETQDVDLGFLADEAAHMIAPLAAKAGVQIERDLAQQAVMRSDDRALLQILTNLLSNAVKFTRPGGRVTVFARHQPRGGLVLGVEDTGIGIAAEEMEKVLSFYGQARSDVTVEGRGTGLGLPIVKRLIEALGGTFGIESKPGIGTRVWGEFPAERVVQARAIA